MIITEILRRLLVESDGVYVSRSEIPDSIRAWVDDKLGVKISKYEIFQSGEFMAGIPWHEADRTYYQIFKANGNEYTAVGDPAMVSGWDNISGNSKKMRIPSGYIVVVVGIYPKRAEIYTSGDAVKFLSTGDSTQLSPAEVYALVVAKALNAPYRPKFEESVYEKLISLGYMARNKAITINGRNYLTSLGRDTVNAMIDQLPTNKYGGEYKHKM